MSETYSSDAVAVWTGRFAVLAQFWFSPLIPVDVVRAALDITGDDHSALTGRGISVLRLGNQRFVSRDQFAEQVAAMARTAQPEPPEQPAKPKPAPAGPSSMLDDRDRLLTKAQAAAFLKISVRQLERLIEGGQLVPDGRAGKSVRFTMLKLRQYSRAV